MKLYRFSPINDLEGLYRAINHIHVSSYELCSNVFNTQLPNAGNMGVFCHYEDEYTELKKIQAQITNPSDDPNQKYFELLNPITIKQSGLPDTIYTHLYIRKPDPYRHQVGDIDFYLNYEDYDKLKNKLLSGETIRGARIFPRNDLDMIELFNPDIDVLAYISTNTMSQKVRIKHSSETNL